MEIVIVIGNIVTIVVDMQEMIRTIVVIPDMIVGIVHGIWLAEGLLLGNCDCWEVRRMGWIVGGR